MNNFDFVCFLYSDIWFWFNFVLIFTFWCPNGLFLRWRKGAKTVLGSNHEVEQLQSFIFLSTLTFDCELMLVSIFTFWGLNELFLGWIGFENCFRVCSCSWTTFIFYGSFNSDIGWFNLEVIFGILMGYFCGWGRIRKLFLGLLM